MQILPFDKEREAAQRERKLQGLNKTLIAQIGLRWIIEAIGNQVQAVIPQEQHSSITLDQALQDVLKTENTEQGGARRDVRKDLRNLADNATTIVGHNLFLDLIYLYACFFGPLPDRVEDFQGAIKKIFPVAIDTKYIADLVCAFLLLGASNDTESIASDDIVIAHY